MRTFTPIAAVAVVAIAAAIVAFVALSGDDGGEAPAASAPSPAASQQPTEAATTAPSPTTMPLSPREQFASFELRPADTDLQFVRGDSADVPPGNGVYFMDIATGEIDGVHSPGDDLELIQSFTFGYDSRLLGLEIEERGQTPPFELISARHLLIDRETQTAYEWDGDARLLDASRRAGRTASTAGSRALFRLPDPDGPDYFLVVDMDSGPEVVARFEIERSFGITPRAGGPVGLLSADGTQAVIVGGDVAVVDLATNAIETVGSVPEFETRNILLGVRNTLDGEGFLVQVQIAGSSQFPEPARWLHFTWTGELIAEGTGESYDLTARGDLMAISETFDFGDGPPICCAVRVVDTLTAQDVYRVVGALLCSQGNRGGLMLADGSGVVVKPLYRMSGYLIAMPDGEFREAPFQRYGGPVPSPTDPNVFFLNLDGHILAVVDANGDTLTSYDPGGVQEKRAIDFVPPWALNDGSEVRFIVRNVGHDVSCGSNVLLMPYVETPPYTEAAVFQLHDDAPGTALFAAPGDEAAIGEIREATRITVLDTQRQQGNAGDEFDLVWARVRLPDGLEGWMVLQRIPRGGV